MVAFHGFVEKCELKTALVMLLLGPCLLVSCHLIIGTLCMFLFFIGTSDTSLLI
jgi:hypothetical protein